MTPAIISRLRNARETKSGWTACCPGHEDRRSSLSISLGDDGRTLVHCHAGCTPETIVSAVGLQMQDLAPNGNGHGKPIKPEIVAAYDYRDETGELLRQVVRYAPKDFRQRKPKAGGGWDWKTSDVRNVLYHLPELLSADHGEWVLVPEGEKDVDRLRSLGWVSTTNCGGAGKWLSEYNAHLAGRKVAILPDNDDVGRKHAEQVAASLLGVAAVVKVVKLPGLPPKGDVSDWLRDGSDERQAELSRLIELAPVWTPAAVGFADQVTAAVAARKPILAPAPPWLPFPIESFPEPIRSFVTGSAAAIGCDQAFVATAILPALASAIGNSRVVLLRSGWTEPAVLWSGLVGDSGCQKSPALDAGTKHVKRRQAAAIEVYRRQREVYDQEVGAFSLTHDDWKKTGRKKGDPEPEAPLEPVCERGYCSDTTIEALSTLLAQSPRGQFVIRDELAGLINSFDQYKGGRGGADVAHWLSMHGARDLVVDRKTGTERTTFVRRAAVSVTGGVQPATLRRVLGAEHFENGLAARFLLAYPPRRRKRWSEAGINQALDKQVEAVFEALYQLQPDQDDGHPEPVVVGLSKDAKTTWVEFYDRHAGRIADASGNEAAVLSKIEGAAARIALVLHLVRNAAGDLDAGDAIDERSVQAGITVAEWFCNEAFRVYALFAETDEGLAQRELVELVERLGGTITPNGLRKRNRRFTTNEEAEVALAALVKAELGTWEPVHTGDAGGRPTTQFRLSASATTTITHGNVGKTEVMVSVTPDRNSERDGQKTGEPSRISTVTETETSGNVGKTEVSVVVAVSDNDKTQNVEAPVAVCDHLDQTTWVVTDGKAHCQVCGKYMGRVR